MSAPTSNLPPSRFSPRTHTIPPTTPHTHTIILLHGRGSTASEFASEFFESQGSSSFFLPSIFPSVKWVFPTSATRWAKTEQEEMSQWFDMASVRYPNKDVERQEEGLKESVTMVLGVVREEAQEVGGVGRVFLGGMSQGCATALCALISGDLEVAGFIGFSGWLPMHPGHSDVSQPAKDVQTRSCAFSDNDAPKPTEQPSGTAAKTPVLLEHCEDDDVVPIVNGDAMKEGLERMSHHVEMKRYPEGAHWVNEPQGIDDFVAFVQRYM